MVDQNRDSSLFVLSSRHQLINVDINNLFLRSRKSRQGFRGLTDDLVRGPINPRATLRSSGAEHTVGTPQSLDVQIGDVYIPVSAISCTAGKLKADFEFFVQHHLIFPETTGAVEYAEDAFLRLHAVARAAPGLRVVVAVVPASGNYWAGLLVVLVGGGSGSGGFG